MIGIGFRERDQAFDFKSALNEYVKYIDRMAQADRLRANSIDSRDEDDTRSRDSSSADEMHMDEHIAPLKEGEKIKVHIRLNKNKITAANAGHGASTGSNPTSPSQSFSDFQGAAHPHGIPKQFLSLRVPPPAATADAHDPHQPMIRPPSFSGGSSFQAPAHVQAEEEDEWGDFTDSAAPSSSASTAST